MNKDYVDVKNIIKKNLSEFLGIEPDDIEDDFSLTEDLHMKPTDLTDFMERVGNLGYDIQSVDMTEIDTFSDLIDALTQHQ